MRRRTLKGSLFAAACLSLGGALLGCTPEPPPVKTPPQVTVPAPPAAEVEKGQVCSEVKNPQGESLLRVVVRNGAGDACNEIDSQAGRPYDEALTDHDLRELFARDLYADVVVALEETSAGRVLAFELKPLPIIASIQFEGAAAMDRAALLSAAGIEGKGYKAAWVKRGAESIAESYRDMAYGKVKVDASAKEEPGGKVAVTYRIVEGPRSTLRAVKLLGNTTFSEAEVREAVKDLLGQPFSEGTRPMAIGRVEELYMNRGKIQASASLKDTSEQPDGAVDLTLSVEEGATFRIGKLKFEGDLCLEIPRVQTKLKGLKKNAVFQRSAVKDDIAALEAACNAAGRKGWVEPRTDLDLKKNTVAVTIRFVPEK